MKYGYSVLLREILEASELDYECCAQFQIVCPECSEPIFKSQRKDDDIQYLSHYKGVKGISEECELRVSGYSIEKIKAMNARSRGQTLKQFLSVFNAQLRAGKGYRFKPKDVKRFIKKSYIFKEARQWFSIEKMDKSIMLKRFEQEMEKWEPDFDRKLRKFYLQKNIAMDVFSLLLSPQESANFTELLALSTMIVGEGYTFDDGQRCVVSDFDPDHDSYSESVVSVLFEAHSIIDFKDAYSLIGHVTIEDIDLKSVPIKDYLLQEISDVMVMLVLDMPFEKMVTKKDTLGTKRYSFLDENLPTIP